MDRHQGKHFRLIIQHPSRKGAFWLSVPLDFATASYGAAVYAAGGDDVLIVADTATLRAAWQAYCQPHRLTVSVVATLLLVAPSAAAPAPKKYWPRAGWLSRFLAKLSLVKKKGAPLP